MSEKGSARAVSPITSTSSGGLAPDADARQLRDFLATWNGHVGAEGHYDFKKTPQRGLAIDSAVVMRWDPGAKEWHLVSNLTGTPIE